MYRIKYNITNNPIKMKNNIYSIFDYPIVKKVLIAIVVLAIITGILERCGFVLTS